MTERLTGIDEKVKRAKKHIGDLETEIARFLDTRPYELFFYCELDTRHAIVAVNVNRDPPIELSTVIGDVINNLRAALDHLFSQLMDCNGQVSGPRDYFPIAKGPDQFVTAVKGLEKKVGTEPMKLLNATEAYQGGKGHGLWQLNELNNADKHRLLVPVGSALSHITVDMGAQMRAHFPDSGDIPSLEVSIRPNQVARGYPLKDGAVVFRDTSSEMNMNPTITFEVAFGEGQTIDGEAVLPALVQLADLVEDTIEPFRLLLGG